MYAVLKVLEFLVFIGVLALAGAFLWPMIKKWLENRGTIKRVKSATYEHTDDVLPDVKAVRAAQAANLKFLGLPSVHATQTVMNVPVMSPEQEGDWIKNRKVVTAARIISRLKQGETPGDLIELEGGYALFASNGKVKIMTKLNLTSSEETLLEKERKEAVEKNDPEIPNFQGVPWRIVSACGEHKPRFAGDKKCSTIQVLSVHSKLGEAGLMSFLPTNLLEMREEDYYDMRAKEVNGERAMIFMYAGGTWTCFMGRGLTDEESRQLKAM